MYVHSYMCTLCRPTAGLQKPNGRSFPTTRPPTEPRSSTAQHSAAPPGRAGPAAAVQQVPRCAYLSRPEPRLARGASERSGTAATPRSAAVAPPARGGRGRQPAPDRGRAAAPRGAPRGPGRLSERCAALSRPRRAGTARQQLSPASPLRESGGRGGRRVEDGTDGAVQLLRFL